MKEEQERLIVHNGLTKLVTRFVIIFYSALMIAFLFYSLGSKYFISPSWSSNMFWVDNVIRMLMMTVTNVFALLICTNLRNGQLICHAILMFIITLICYLIPFMIQTTSFIPFIYLMIYLLLTKENKKTNWIYTFIFIGTMIIYQVFAIPTKIGAFYLGYNDVTPLEMFILSIDLYFIYGVILFMKGEFTYGLSRQVVLPSAFSDPEIREKDCREVEELETYIASLTPKQRLKASAGVLGLQIVQLLGILVVCALANRLLVAIALIPAYWLFSSIIKGRYHGNTMLECTLVTIACFTVFALFILPFSISLYSVFIGAFIMTIGLHRLAQYQKEQQNK